MSKDVLLYPELIRQTPVIGRTIEKKFRKRVDEAVRDPLVRDVYGAPRSPEVSVVLRTLNEKMPLYWLLDDLDQQENAARTEVIVIDNESTDGTADIARQFGATVIELAREDFNYPRSMNAGVEAASNNLVFMSIGHAKLSNRFLLAGAARHFSESDMGGVFSHTFLGINPSRTESLAYMADELGSLRPAHKVAKAGMGVLGATNCMIKKDVWEALGGFDEAHAMGGEDGAFAKRMLEEGLSIMQDPVIAVHHSHGLGPINFARQVRRWRKSANPHPIDLKSVARSRPDIDFS